MGMKRRIILILLLLKITNVEILFCLPPMLFDKSRCHWRRLTIETQLSCFVAFLSLWFHSLDHLTYTFAFCRQKINITGECLQSCLSNGFKFAERGTFNKATDYYYYYYRICNSHSLFSLSQSWNSTKEKFLWVFISKLC